MPLSLVRYSFGEVDSKSRIDSMEEAGTEALSFQSRDAAKITEPGSFIQSLRSS